MYFGGPVQPVQQMREGVSRLEGWGCFPREDVYIWHRGESRGWVKIMLNSISEPFPSVGSLVRGQRPCGGKNTSLTLQNRLQMSGGESRA